MGLKRHHGDLFVLLDQLIGAGTPPNLLVVTTNVTRVHKSGRQLSPSSFGVMGTGYTLQAAQRWPDFRAWWAGLIERYGEVAFGAMIPAGSPGGMAVGALTTKINWWEKAKFSTLDNALWHMCEWIKGEKNIHNVLMPFPENGRDGLNPNDTWVILERRLGSGFTVCYT